MATDATIELEGPPLAPPDVQRFATSLRAALGAERCPAHGPQLTALHHWRRGDSTAFVASICCNLRASLAVKQMLAVARAAGRDAR